MKKRKRVTIMASFDFSQLKLFFIAYFMAIPTFNNCASIQQNTPKKRQIYREHVVPHTGGRIPDSAFETDRLFLNQLQKHGISIPDGIVAEQRNPEVYPYPNRSSRKVYQLALLSDNYYTGGFHYQYPIKSTVDTTYLYPPVHGQIDDTASPSSSIVIPVYRSFQLQQPHFNTLKYRTKDKALFLNADSTNRIYTKPKSYQNFNFIHDKYSAFPRSVKTSVTSFLTDLPENRNCRTHSNWRMSKIFKKDFQN